MTRLRTRGPTWSKVTKEDVARAKGDMARERTRLYAQAYDVCEALSPTQRAALHRAGRARDVPLVRFDGKTHPRGMPEYVDDLLALSHLARSHLALAERAQHHREGRERVAGSVNPQGPGRYVDDLLARRRDGGP